MDRKDDLLALGMKNAFGWGADFSGNSPAPTYLRSSTTRPVPSSSRAKSSSRNSDFSKPSSAVPSYSREGPMRFDTWLTLSASDLDLNALAGLSPTREADFGGKLGHPTTFRTYRDPQGNFLLRYPQGWTVEADGRLEVRSKRLPLSARVEVLPGPEISWDRLGASLLDGAGLLVGEKRLPGPPSQVRALVVDPGGLFEGRVLAYSSGAVVVLLSTRMLQAPNPRLERYGRAVLAAVRREFRVPAP